jgi:hypothetical protein
VGKEANLAHFIVLSKHFLEGTEEKNENLQDN